MVGSGYCENCGYGYLGVPGQHRSNCPRYGEADHQWAYAGGKPWSLSSASALCAVCGRTPDGHPTPSSAPGIAPGDC